MIQSESGRTVPTSAAEAVGKPGLYLRLHHGRSYLGQHLDDWGTDGPIFGPLEFVHCAYLSDIDLGFVDAYDAELYFKGLLGTAHELKFSEDMVVYNGVYYGDWTVFVV